MMTIFDVKVLPDVELQVWGSSPPLQSPQNSCVNGQLDAISLDFDLNIA